MKLIVLNILISCVLVIKPCLSTEDKPNTFTCPDSSGTSLVTTVVSGCKVHYTCKNAVVAKIFQCSDSQILAGTTHVCQENPQCPGIDSFEELINLQSTVEESKITESDTSVVSEDNKNNLPAFMNFMNTTISFIKCLVSVDDIDGFCKTCIDTNLFQKKPFLEIDLSPKVFDVFAKFLNNSKSSEGHKHDSTWDKIFGQVLKDFVQHLSPQCELVCKDVSKKPEHNYEDKSQSEPHASIEDFLKQSSNDGYVPDQVLSGDRVRRSPIPISSLIRSVLMHRTELPFTTVEPPTTPSSAEGVNNTMMSKVIVPFIQDIVDDEAALRNATKLVRIVFEGLVPLVIDILEASKESFDSDNKRILKIPHKLVQSTIQKISVEGYPILSSLLHSKLSPLLLLLSRNVKLLMDSWSVMESRLEPNIRELINKGIELYRKYHGMIERSSEDFIHTYSLIEIQQDIESFYSLLPEISKELLLKNFAVFQYYSGITTQNISKLLLDVPKIVDAIIPAEFVIYTYFLYVTLMI